MKKKLIALVGAGLLLTGCAASSSGTAQQLCVSAAEDEVEASITTDDLESTNMGDALYESGIKDERETSEDNAMFSVLGDFTYNTDGTENRRSMMCMVTFEDGKAGEPELTINGG